MFFLDQDQDGDYLVSVMTAEHFERSAAVQASLHDIDAYHQAFKRDTWESGQRLELNRIGEQD